jgi:hypothetical protein
VHRLRRPMLPLRLRCRLLLNGPPSQKSHAPRETGARLFLECGGLTPLSRFHPCTTVGAVRRSSIQDDSSAQPPPLLHARLRGQDSLRRNSAAAMDSEPRVHFRQFSEDVADEDFDFDA